MSDPSLFGDTSNHEIPVSPSALRLQLVRILVLSPDSTAKELEKQLENEGLWVTRTQVNRELYSVDSPFESDGGTTPRWQVESSIALSSILEDMIRPELVRFLTLLPGTTVRKLVPELEARGLPVTKTEVNSILYTNRSCFWSDGATPPRWQLISGGVPTPISRLQPPATGSSSPFTLYAWQEEALAIWRTRGQRGVVEAVTGAGKTMVGLAAAWGELQSGGKVQVLVPSIALLDQWAASVEKYFPKNKLGLLGNGHQDRLSDVDILVAVVNSARTTLANTGGRRALLVADECHHYASERNAEALDVDVFEARLGLSATYQRSDDGHLEVLDPFFEGTCYELNYADAISDEVTAHFKVALVGVKFNDEEQAEYEEVDERARRLRSWLINQGGVVDEPFGAFMAEVSQLAKEGGEGETTGKARWYLNAFSRRRQLLAETTAKRNLLNNLVPAVLASERVLVFTERQEAAEDAAATLSRHGVQAGAVHSGLPPDTRRTLFSQFAGGELSALCAPRVLDVGLLWPNPHCRGGRPSFGCVCR